MKNLCFFPAHCTLTPHLSLPRCIFRKNCTQPTITLWEVFLNNLESEVYTIIIRNSISWEFCLFSLIFYSIIYLYQYVLIAQHSKNENHGIRSHHVMGHRWGNSVNSVRLYFLGAPKSLQMVTAAMKLKDTYSLEGKL